ncbi:hypothetical protein [Actinokineospora bangkokensis]|uniref:Uncharacterized protein n=1 Tax=Actinokineospora bangkokensis TaxID=1193682 RepID=A0A1Q9LTT7_9PSEU|nr:hypothetical protein [Actinokineospora bangkokensis]OLR95423.1 hypothetical protein BJP25_06665 [Actinokineospora bangkokensis]
MRFGTHYIDLRSVLIWAGAAILIIGLWLGLRGTSVPGAMCGSAWIPHITITDLWTTSQQEAREACTTEHGSNALLAAITAALGAFALIGLALIAVAQSHHNELDNDPDADDRATDLGREEAPGA